MALTRRAFLQRSSRLVAGAGLASSLGLAGCSRPPLPSAEDLVIPRDELFFDISLAEWSLHRNIWFGGLDHLDFAATAKREFGIEAVEYVSSFFTAPVTDTAYLDEMKLRADDAGVRSLLIMVDAQGNLVAHGAEERRQAVERHHAWVEAAQRLGCHAMRVNLPGKGRAEDIAAYAVESLSALTTFAAPFGISVLVEPHGGYSSDGRWLADVIASVGMDNCGTLPDFGNFTINLLPPRRYDRYLGVEELMPYAKAISAKAHRFDDQGNEPEIDFYRMLQIVKDAGYTGHVGIEYEGNQLDEYDGVRATLALLIRAGRAVG